MNLYKLYKLYIGDIIYEYHMMPIILILFFIIIVMLIILVMLKRESKKKLRDAYDKGNATLLIAQKASEAKGNFMSRMSHEIRTPLNAIIGYNTVAQNEMITAKSDEEREIVWTRVKDCLEKSDVASKHLLTIINDVLDMSAIESGKIRVVYEPFDLKKSISSIAMMFSYQTKEKNINFDVSFSGFEKNWLMGDQMRINQILTNLLSNAVKFTQEGGNVKLNVCQTIVNKNRVKVHFEVTDTGIGMSKEYINHIWEPFEQADKSISKRFGGTGLGLSITKNLVELMNGKIYVESESNIGTTFYIDIEFLCVKQENTHEEQELNKINIEKNLQRRKKLAIDFKNMRILLAEDNIMNMEIAKQILESAGVAVDGAFDGKEVVEIFEKSDAGTYDVILMDIQMPKIDGHEATRIIRHSAHPDAKTVPIIAMTADVFSENVSEAIDCGMNAHISKPIDIHKLFDTLHEYI